jgi:ComF family protein
MTAQPVSRAATPLAARLGSALAACLDPWLPRACALCEGVLRQPGAGLCRHCRLGLPGRLRPRCARCGLGLPPGTTAVPHGRATPAPSACPACQDRRQSFDAVCVLADYAPPLDRLVGALKFRGDMALAGALGRELAPRLRRLTAPPQLLVPVPLSDQRLRERGYDQALGIARALGRAAALPVRAALRRTRATLAQSSLPLARRQANLRDAFALAPGCPALPPHVGLIDDVMTTGATLDAAARVLREAGAAQITVVVAARTP